MARHEGNRFTAPKKLLRENEQARATMDFLEARGDSRVTNALPEREIPEEIRDLMRTGVRALRAYCQSLKIPVKLNEKDILKRTKFVADDHVSFRDGNKKEYAYGPLEVAAYEAISDLFIIEARKAAAMDRGQFVRMFIHELVHSIAAQGVRIVEQPNGEIHTLGYGGYQSQRTHHPTGAGHTPLEARFTGVNEAMTDFIAIRAIQHAKLLPYSYVKTFFEDGYVEEKNLMYVIFKTIAERTGRQAADLEEIYTKGYLKGSRMHLREIEHHFGPHSLRILAAMGKYGFSTPEAQLYNNMIANWFVSTDEQKRNDLYHAILAEEK